MAKYHGITISNSQAAVRLEQRNYGDMLGAIRAAFERVQGSAAPRPSLRSALGSALLLGSVVLNTPALASPTAVRAPDGWYWGKIDPTVTMGNSSECGTPSRRPEACDGGRRKR